MTNPVAGLGEAATFGGSTVDRQRRPGTGTTYSLIGSSVAAGNPAVFTITRTSSSSAVNVGFVTTDGTAQAGIDYDAQSLTITFPIGVSTETVSVPTHINKNAYGKTLNFSATVSMNGQAVAAATASIAEPASTSAPIGVNLASPSTISGVAGQAVNYTLNFTGGPTAFPMTVFVHFLDSTGNIIFQDDHQPPVPTTSWSGSISDPRSLTLPATASGSYRVLVGLYYSGGRMTLLPGSGVIDNGDQRYQVATLSVQAPAVPVVISPVPVVVSPSPSPSPTSTSSPASTPTPVAQNAWSNPLTWPTGQVPAAGSDVTIPAGQTVTLDVSPPALGGITIYGNLIFANADLNLTAKWIMLMSGSLQIGSSTQPYTNQATITLTGTDTTESVNGMGTRGIMVMGGALELHGHLLNPAWTRLAQNAPAGSTAVTLRTAPQWQVGDQIAISTTDFYRVAHTESSSVTSVGGNVVSFANALASARWGALQYVSSTGITTTPTTTVTSKVIDEGAEVADLNRNIVVQAPNDALWASGFGAQVMIMNPGIAHVEGVRLNRMGQAGIKGRYPFHWHMWSYNSVNGTSIGDATGQYLRDSVVSPSSQRCVVLHGTNGVTIQNNVCYDILGHAIFLEDAVERRNTITGNLVMKVRQPMAGKQLLTSDGQPAGFWITNPDNQVTSNVASDADTGFWLGFPQKPQGLNKLVPIEPNHIVLGAFSNNTTHSNQTLGLQIGNAPYDDAGDTDVSVLYQPVVGELALDSIWNRTPAPPVFDSLTSYKHEGVADQGSQVGSLWNRTAHGILSNFIVADFSETAFRGSSYFCEITNNLVAGSTLNNATPTLLVEKSGAASYHSQCQIHQNIFVNLPAIQAKESGAFRTEDYYTDGVDKGLYNNYNNTMINTDPGYRYPSPNTLTGTDHENWSLAGALWDPYGLWGAPGSYWTYNHPFFTTGTTCSAVRGGFQGNDQSCVGPYYGFGMNGAPDNVSAQFDTPISYKRNENGAEWFVDDGLCTWRLGGMRNTAMVKNGSYTITFPAGRQSDGRGTCTTAQLAAALPAPKQIVFSVTNIVAPDDGYLLAIEYSGAVTPYAYYEGGFNYYEAGPKNPYGNWASVTAYLAGDPTWKTQFRGQYWNPLTPGNSLTDVQNGNGLVYWQDRPNNLLWVLIRRNGIPSDTSTSALNPITYVFDSSL